MASILLPECLEKIFMNLINRSDPIFSNSIETYEIKDLYSCTLVSRYWCRISTPLLYSYPFCYFRYFRNLTLKKKSEPGKDAQDYYKLIRTLLNCIPQSEIEEIINSTIKPAEPISYITKVPSTFNYATFIHGLHFDDKFFLDHGKQIWMPSYVPIKEIPEKLCNSIINHLVRYLCENCNNLTKLEFLREKLQVDLKEILTKDKLNGLKELYCSSPEDTFYNQLSATTSNLELLHNSKITSLEHANALSSLISSQRNLKRIILSEDLRTVILNDISDRYIAVFCSLSTQKEWLERLEFTCLCFKNINQEALNSLCSLKNLKELKLYKCKSLGVDKLENWAKSLNLKSLEYNAFSSSNLTTDFELLRIIFQHSSSTLTKLVLEFNRENDQGHVLFKDIQQYLPSITHLELPMLYASELSATFKKITELVKFSTTLSYHGNWNQDLRYISKLVPNSLQMIQFREMIVLEISSETLNYFLKECLNKGGELKYLEIGGKCELSQEYFDVAKQLEVQLIKY